MRKKILWLSHLVPYPPKGGVLMRSYNLLRELSRYHDVSLVAINQRSLFSSFFPDQEAGLDLVKKELGSFLTVIDILEEPTSPGRYSRLRLALRSLFGLPYSVRWLYSQRIAQRIDEVIAEGRFDMIHADTISLVPYVYGAAHVPLVLDHHNVESHMMLRRAMAESNPLKKLYFAQEGVRLRLYERGVLDRFVHHFVCSEPDKARLLELDGALSVSIIPNGIAMPLAPPLRRPDRGSPKFLFIGGLTWYPNVDAVIFLLRDIWPMLSARLPGATLDIIGRGPSDAIRRLADRLPDVTLHGYVDDIETFYQQATAYICPIRDGGGTKLKVLDALAARVPLVAHAIAAEGIDIEHRKHALLGSSAEELVQLSVEAAERPESMQAMADAGYQLMRSRYDFSSIGRSFANIFSDLGPSSARGE